VFDISRVQIKSDAGLIKNKVWHVYQNRICERSYFLFFVTIIFIKF
jgi:hypothetical protein